MEPISTDRLLQELSKRDRTLGRIEQTLLQRWENLEPGSSDYISIPTGQVEELLMAIAALYQEQP